MVFRPRASAPPAVLAAALAAALLGCGSETPSGPRLTPMELEEEVSKRVSELWEPTSVDLTEAWPGERHTFEVVCQPTRAVDVQLSNGQLLPHEIEFAVTQGPPFRSGVDVRVDSSWARELVVRYGRAAFRHELPVEVTVTLGDRIRLPEDKAVWVQVAGRKAVTSSFWIRLYGLGQGRVVVEVPADGRCPPTPARDGLWDFN